MTLVSFHHPADRTLTVAVDRSAGGAVVLQPSGCLDESTGDLLCAVIEAEARSGNRTISVDLQYLAHLDGSGMLALRRAHEYMRTAGGRLTVYGMDLSRLAGDAGRSHLVLVGTRDFRHRDDYPKPSPWRLAVPRTLKAGTL